MENLAHSASLHADVKRAPAKPAIQYLAHRRSYGATFAITLIKTAAVFFVINVYCAPRLV